MKHEKIIKKYIDQLSQKDDFLIQIRTYCIVFFFVGFVGLSVSNLEFIKLPWLLLTTFVFISTVFLHKNIRSKKLIVENYSKLLRERKSKSQLDWENIPTKLKNDEIEDLNEQSLSKDFNLVGEGGLFSLIDTTITVEGTNLLRNRMFDRLKPYSQVVQLIQKVKEISKLNVLRSRFLRSGLSSDTGKIDIEGLEKALSRTLTSKLAPYIVVVLSLIQVGTLIKFIEFLLSGGTQAFLYLEITYIALLFMSKSQFYDPFNRSIEMSLALRRLLPVFKILENFSTIDDQEITRHFKIFKESKPTLVARKIERVSSLLSIQGNMMAHALVNFFVPWDYALGLYLEKLRKKGYQSSKEWKSELIEIDYLVSCGEFTHVNSDYIFPKLNADTEELFSANSLGHPLINKSIRVENSYKINTNNQISILTGSNMSGKSTFLRTVGINIILAQMGLPVAAKECQLSSFQLCSLIQAHDRLSEGISLYLFEVQRIKYSIDQARSGKKILFLVDEIFRGTNNRERYIGAQAVISELIKYNAFAIISTHDIEIAKWADKQKQIKNWHFSEQISDEDIVFDYSIYPGICQTTNALKILSRHGILHSEDFNDIEI